MVFRDSWTLDTGPETGPETGPGTRFCPVRSIVPRVNMAVIWSKRPYCRPAGTYRAPRAKCHTGYRPTSDRLTDRPTDRPTDRLPAIDYPRSTTRDQYTVIYKPRPRLIGMRPYVQGRTQDMRKVAPVATQHVRAGCVTVPSRVAFN